MHLTNNNNIPLTLAVWLASDNYDFFPGSKSISATSLLKPVKQIVLERTLSEKQEDVLDLLAAVYGSSLHSAIEAAWTSDKLPLTLGCLGLPQKQIDRVKVNPSEPQEGDINVYLEKRSERSYEGWTISGKFDIVIGGHLSDNKSTSVWTYIYKSRINDYVLQCSIYKWLNPELITDDTFSINYIFTDWSKSDAAIKAKDGYPQCRLLEQKYTFLTMSEVEHYIKNKLNQVDKYIGFKSQSELPDCPEEELWLPEIKYKYYANPENRNRATKVFLDQAEAYAHLNQKKKGIVVRDIGKPKRCAYCACFGICEQRRRYYPES